MGSNLGDPRVPKPGNQGGAKKGTPKAPLKGGNSQKPAPPGVTKRGTVRPGTGGKGSKNNPSRT